MRPPRTYAGHIGSHRPIARASLWLAVVAASAVALVGVVVHDLQRAVAVQTEQARAQARREAEREAADLRAALVGEAALDRAPPSARFALRRGELLVPDELGALAPETIDYPARLDALGRERLRRAERSGSVEELEPLFRDAGVDAATRAWLAVGCAWRAQRDGGSAVRDAWLARVWSAPPSDPQVAASARLLEATRDRRLHDLDAALRLVPRLPAAMAEAWCARLAALGIDTQALSLVAAQARAWRETLRIAGDLLPQFRVAAAPLLAATSDGIAVYLPASERGAVLELGEAVALAQTLRTAPTGATLVAASATAPLPEVAVPIVAAHLGLLPAPVLAGSRFSGAAGTALLAAALALLCGGASLFAARALRREAQAQRARAEFLTTVTHELKTPLAGVRLVAELLGDGHVDDPAERATWLARLQAEAARLGLLIENVLDLGRLERGERAHAPERLDLGEFVADTAALFAPLAERDGFALRVAAPPGVCAEFDRNGLRQALLNLLDNARKYGKSPIEVAVATRGASAVVTVCDHGDGVPAAEREAIFARFVRGRAHAHGSVPGVGLGLHLARAIAQRHGGELRALDGPGARFELSLPLAAAAADSSP